MPKYTDLKKTLNGTGLKPIVLDELQILLDKYGIKLNNRPQDLDDTIYILDSDTNEELFDLTLYEISHP